MENGTYSVTLTIKDSNGDEAQITKNVEVEILINSQGDDGTDDSTDDQSTNGDGDGDGDENDNDNEGDGINSFPTIFLLFAIAIPMIYLGRKIRKK